MPVVPRILAVALMLTMASGLAHAQGPDADVNAWWCRSRRAARPT